MLNNWFVVHDGLIGASRLPTLARPRQGITTAELLLLLACGGASAAAAGFIKLRLGIPGHSIVLSALPMALGLALSPRHAAGTLMSVGAVGTAWAFVATGAVTYGSGAFVSLSLLGPMMDVALHHARSGARIYVALILAGVATNVLALASRATTKLLGLDLGGRPFDSWWLQALGTYTIAGVIAGLLGALCWFHFQDAASRRQPRA